MNQDQARTDEIRVAMNQGIHAFEVIGGQLYQQQPTASTVVPEQCVIIQDACAKLVALANSGA